MDFFEIVADFLGPVDNPFLSMYRLFRNGGFIVLLPLAVWLVHMLWLEWVQNQYRAAKKLVLLAIDVPRANEQSMKAVEQIIATLHAVEYVPNQKEKYVIGFVQDQFALEIISVDGYIQYFIRCDDYNVDLVKGAVFAQYPDAEMVEVEDYVPNVPQSYPNETHDLWGMEIKLGKEDPYPIKTYEFFEDKLTGTFADPMAALLETMSRLKPGEQIWIQMLITPQGSGFRDKGIKLVNDLIGKKVPRKRTFLDSLVDTPIALLNEASNQILNTSLVNQGAAEEPSQGNFLNMTSGEKIVVEEVQKKIARLLFRTKMRFIYVSKKEIMHVSRAISPVLGALRQFSTLDLNALSGSLVTMTSRPTYYLVKYRSNSRKNNLMFGYRTRNPRIGETMFVMSTAEIATIFHFPLMQVRAPLVSKTESKKAEPPFTLPMERAPFTPPQPEPTAAPIPEPPVEKPAQRPIQAPPLAPPAGQAPQMPKQLHSMPGLPPGIKPVPRPTPTEGAQRPYGEGRSFNIPAAPVVQPPPAQQTDQGQGTSGTPPADLPFV